MRKHVNMFETFCLEMDNELGADDLVRFGPADRDTSLVFVAEKEVTCRESICEDNDVDADHPDVMRLLREEMVVLTTCLAKCTALAFCASCASSVFLLGDGATSFGVRRLLVDFSRGALDCTCFSSEKPNSSSLVRRICRVWRMVASTH